MGGVSTPSHGSSQDDRLIAGRYRLQRVIGQGAMGVVWLGYDELLHRAVAVKEVQSPPGMPAAEASLVRERTLREARAIASLTHPNVISVFDVARRGDDPFVVMELLRSRSLADVIRDMGPCNSEQAAAVADAVAAGLEAAHRRGVTHRDVKPGNVLVGDDGQIKLTDFGIARNLAEVTMTHSGMIMGTPAYIAPEVASGDPVTPASDLWGLGAMLFAAVTGGPPYDAGDALETVVEVVHGEVPELPEGAPLDDIIGDLMVKDPAERISLVEVRRRIRPLLPEPGVRVFPVPEPDTESGPADDKPTRRLQPTAEPGDEAPAEASPQLAADPGPLPFQPSSAPPPSRPALPRPPMPRSSQSAPLAPLPGPLPFQPVGAPRRRRGALAAAVLGILAVLLFLGAAGGGFAAARVLGGAPLRPPTATTPAQTTAPTTEPAPVTTVTLVAATPTAGPDGDFAISVPQGWTEFTEQRPAGALPASVALHYVSPDGADELTVEHFADYYPRHSVDDYLGAQNKTWPLFLQQSRANANGPGGNSIDAEQDIEYRTSASSDPAVDSANRTTYAETLPHGDDLWVLSVTTPTQGEGFGKTVFDKVSDTFSVGS
ncbi:MAG TPA: serine/threonine-protein kinase [Pseudonocardiaceae bacterium]|jgi:serine/threonine protein kinase|nr:serine/threonine-protein kinase [Pseudonocardiaceae bacterium]